MDIETKWLTAAIEVKDTGGDTGGFEAILSTPDVDRDGEAIDIKSWGTLPESVPVNVDHNMSVDGLIGTGIPKIEDGVVKLSVTFASTPEAQRVRTLVQEKHIRATSVEFLRKTQTDQKGVKTTSREMIGAAVTNYPANPHAVILAAKAGARNSRSDSERIQAIHDHAVALGATPDATKAVKGIRTYEEVDHPILYVDVDIQGSPYILTFWVDSEGDPHPCDIIADATGDSTEVATDNAVDDSAGKAIEPPADESPADEDADAKSLIDMETEALLKLAESYL
jgi:hypothetical protein